MSVKKELPSLRILIVEDNLDIAENIADYLEVQGHVLDFAMDGIGGLHLALTQDYDAIVLDIMLPAMDGLTFCRKLREQGAKQTPVLMLTARDTLSDNWKGLRPVPMTILSNLLNCRSLKPAWVLWSEGPLTLSKIIFRLVISKWTWEKW